MLVKLGMQVMTLLSLHHKFYKYSGRDNF